MNNHLFIVFILILRILGRDIKIMENINLFPVFYPLENPSGGALGTHKESAEKKLSFHEIPTLTCACFYYYVFTESVERDIIVGTDKGDLAVVAFTKFSIVKRNAHTGMINILKFVFNFGIS